jgi:hypothetical protein
VIQLLLVLPFLFLLVIVVVIVVRIFSQELEFGRRQCCAFGALHRRLFLGRQRCRLALGGFALAHSAVILPRIENQVQPWHHLLDRRQRAGRTGFTGLTARTGRALHAGLALRAGLAGFALRTFFTAFALWARLAFRSRLSLWPCVATFALRAGFSLRAGLATRTFKSRPAGMTLRSGPARLAARALRPLSSLPDRRFVGHVLTPKK